MASKAQHIRLLYDAGVSVADIASMLGVRPEYVRVCARQRRNGCAPADLKDKRAAYAYGDREAARKAHAEAYRKYRAQGHSRTIAISKAGAAYTHAMIKTGRQRRFEKLAAQGD